MSEQMNRQTLQDQHLDMMIRLAFLKDEEEAIQQLLDESDPTLTPQQESIANQLFRNALRAAEARNRRDKITLFVSKTKKIFPRLIQIAASIVLIIGIATPIAIAASSEFRSRVMQLLLEIDDEKNEAHFSFQENRNIDFFVPEIWEGQYYPSYIPRGFNIVDYDSIFHCIEFEDANGSKILFSEYDENITSMSGTENATINKVYISGKEGTLIDGYTDGIHCVNIIWATDTKWFELMTYGLNTSEVLLIAESVRTIIK